MRRVERDLKEGQGGGKLKGESKSLPMRPHGELHSLVGGTCKSKPNFWI